MDNENSVNCYGIFVQPGKSNNKYLKCSYICRPGYKDNIFEERAFKCWDFPFKIRTQDHWHEPAK